MATFVLKTPEFNTPTAVSLKAKWKNIPDEGIRAAVAYEYQYFLFHDYLAGSLGSKVNVLGPKPQTHVNNLDFSLRAGALKAQVLVAGSIAEAVLRAHAEKRGMALNSAEHGKTFGNVLKAWNNNKNPFKHKDPLPDVAPYWDDLRALHSARNEIHLYAKKEKLKDYYEGVIQKAEVETKRAKELLEKLMKLKSA